MSEVPIGLVCTRAVTEADLGRLVGRSFTVRSTGHSTVTRTWLDTPDWRLDGAGLNLEQAVTDGSDQLTLRGTDGAILASLDGPPPWPALLPGMPAGAVRDRLGPVVEMRALVPVARARSTVTDVEIRNSDAKIVVRAILDQPSHDGHDLGARVTLCPLRGYQRQADRIAAALVQSPDILRETSTLRSDALTAAGRSPGDDRAPAAKLTAAMPAATAIQLVLDGFRSTVEHNIAGVVDDIDTEFLHDLRVAVRRARSTLKLTGDVLAGDTAGLAEDLKWLGDLTSPTRDLDVYLLGLHDMAAGLRSASAGDLLPFRRHLAARRRAELRRLSRVLGGARMEATMTRWAELGDAAADDVSAALLGAQRIARAYRKVLKLGSAIDAESPAESLHTLRKRCKELRYLLEIFRPLHPKEAHRDALKALKVLQECLGDFQDSEVQGEAVRRYATDMLGSDAVPAATVLAMGELAGQLLARQDTARDRFTSLFDDFASAPTQQWFAALTEAAR